MTDYIGVGKGSLNAGGYAFRAPLGTTLPTTASEDLDSAFEEIGLISNDGVVFSRSETTNTYRDWADRVIYTDSTERTETARITYVETTPNVLEEYNGNATGTEGSFYSDRDGAHAAYVYVFDSVVGDSMINRTVCPNGKVTGVDDLTRAPGNLLGYPCTYTFSYDATAGFTVRDYYASTASSSSGSGSGGGSGSGSGTGN